MLRGVSIVGFLAIFLLLSTSALALLLCWTGLGALLICCRVLFIVASDIIQCLLVKENAVIGQSLYIFYDHLVVWVLKVVFVALEPHIAGNIVNRQRHCLVVLFVDESVENFAYIFAILLERNVGLRVL